MEFAEDVLLIFVVEDTFTGIIVAFDGEVHILESLLCACYPVDRIGMS